MSSIEWTDVTENPITVETGGHWCRKVSPGCANCYAETINQSSFFSFASHLKYSGVSPQLRFNRTISESWGSAQKPKKRFVCSMTDLFGDWVPQDWQHAVFDGAIAAPKQTIQLLTKRPEVAVRSIHNWLLDHPQFDRLPANVWVGMSIENNDLANVRYPYFAALSELVKIPWISYEPALGPVDWNLYASIAKWVVLGGESGKGARSCDLRWLMSAVEKFHQKGVAIFVKQLGAKPFYDGHFFKAGKKGGNLADFPLLLQVRQFPGEGDRP